MGGIIGIVGKTDVAALLVKSLARLDDLRDDSCGLAILDEEMGIDLRKHVGPVQEVAGQFDMISAQRAIKHCAYAMDQAWGRFAGKCPTSSQLRSELRDGP